MQSSSGIKCREESGASLALGVSLLVLITLIGLCATKLVTLLGGGRELQNATDSGNLSVARSAANQLGINLQAGGEQSNFSGLLNSNNQVDLVSYNRIVGQCLLVALNAEAENTAQAKTNSSAVLALLQTGNSCIGQRLLSVLSSPQNMDPYFNHLANSNAVGLLSTGSVTPQEGSYSVGYMYPSGLTNVFLDSTIVPNGASLPANTLSNTKASSGFPYVSGYQNIAFAPIGEILSGVSMQPMQPPHLVANADFNAHTQQPVPNIIVPPNAFRSVGTAVDGELARTLASTSSAVCGVLNQDFPACIPHGYLVIQNGPGDSDSSPLPSPESIFNNQLFTGIFVANNGVFSTDESLIQAWADYNAGGQSGQAPTTAGLFSVNGQPVTGQQNGITGLGGNGFPVMADYTNVQGPNAIAGAAAMLPAFETAYPSSQSQGANGCTLTAVEKLKAEVMELYASGAGGTPASVAPTGLRLFNHSQAYPVAEGQSPEFTTPGNIAQLCQQVSPSGYSSLLSQVKLRMRQIKPSANANEINEILGLDSSGNATSTGQTINLGQTYYIWVDDTNTFRMTQSLPTWHNDAITSVTTADGSAQQLSDNYQTIGYSVDPVGECGFNQTLFADQPNPQTDYLGSDSVTWTPSCGSSNLLGELQFGENISGTAVVLTANSLGSGGSGSGGGGSGDLSSGGSSSGDVSASCSSVMPAIQSYIDGLFPNSYQAMALLGGYLNISDTTAYDQALQQIKALGQGHVTSVSIGGYGYGSGGSDVNVRTVTVTTDCGTESYQRAFYTPN